MSSKDAADKYYETLQAQRQAFIDSAEAAGFNSEQVQALADEVFALPSETEMKIIAQTDTAEEKLRLLKQTLESIPNNTYKRITLESFQVGSRTVTAPGVDANATGGLYENGVRKFASGEFLPGIYPATPGGIHHRVMAEAGFDEMYGTTDPRHAARTYGIWTSFGDRMGFTSQPQPSQSARPIEVKQTIQTQPGMSPEQVARIAEERLSFALRSA